MLRPRVALFNYLEGHQREDVYRKRWPIAKREIDRLTRLLTPDVELLQMPKAEVRSKADLLANIAALGGMTADAVLLHVPIFTAPAMVAHTASLLDRPMALVGNESLDSLSLLALLASAGAIDQIGIPYKRIPGDLADEDNKVELVAYLRAATAASRIKGMTFGALGGRSLGISTGTADPALWERTFGVDIEHVDQYEIVRRAEKIDEEELVKYRTWLTLNLAGIDFNDRLFTPAQLDRQIRSYVATKAIVRDYELDFVGVKCQPEMSNGYALQCLSVSLLNDPYDADGPKQPVACSCEADHDGALTMQVLKLLSGGEPTSLNDIASVSQNDMILANCGAMATWFAGQSNDPAENLGRVRMVPHSFGEAGGGAMQFVCCDGPVTLARLCRKGDRYWMGVVTGESEHRDRNEVSESLAPRPLLLARIRIDKRSFLGSFRSNHILAVRGNYARELAEFCKLLGIEYQTFDTAAAVGL